MSWYFYFSLKQLFPTQRRLSFFSFAAIAGVAIGIAVLFIVMSVMNGFQFEIRKKIVEFQGDIQIGNGSVLPLSEELAQFLSSQTEIKSFMPYASGIVMLKFEDRPIFPIIQGVDWPKGDVIRSYVKQHLLCGNSELYDDDSIFISSHLADKLGIAVDDTVELYSPLALEELKEGNILLPRELRIAGIVKDPEGTASSLSILCSLKLMQELYGLGEAVHGYILHLQPHVDPTTYAAHLNSYLAEPYCASSWIENHQELLSALRLEKNMMFFVLLFVLIIAAFSFSCALVFNVVKKTREIGLLQALGATPHEIALCFCIQGFVIGLMGSIVGFLLGGGILAIRNSIMSAFTFCLSASHGSILMNPYTHLPVHCETHDVVSIFLFANVICILAGLIPAWRASKISPAQALRLENGS